MHLEPAAPVNNASHCCDSMQMSMRDVILGPGTNSRPSATWCCSPMKTWSPLPAAMRRMQVQVRRIVTCVMAPVFYRRPPACGLAGGRDSKEQELRGTGSAVLVLMRARNAIRNATNSFDAMSIEPPNVNDRALRRKWFPCSALAKTKWWHDCLQYSSLQC